MTEEEGQQQETKVLEEIEEEDELEKVKAKNVLKIKALMKELDKIERGRDPNIRICPRCFSTRVRIDDTLGHMGITTGYPVCRCLDCGWKSNKWIYLDRTMSEEDRERFLNNLVEEEISK